MHDRRVRQRAVGARRVVVGHHDVEPRSAGGRHLLDRRDRAVDGHQQVGPAGGEPLDGRGREPVAVVDPARQIPVDVRAERPQRPHEHRRRRDPVDVVVAVHGDPRPPADVTEDPARGFPQAAERVERMDVLGGEKPPRRLLPVEPAAHQHLREHVRHPERALEALCGRIGVRREGEAGVGRNHGRRSVRPPSDGITSPAEACDPSAAKSAML